MPFDGLSDRGNSSDNSSKLLVRAILTGWKPTDYPMPPSRCWKASIVTVLTRIAHAQTETRHFFTLGPR